MLSFSGITKHLENGDQIPFSLVCARFQVHTSGEASISAKHAESPVLLYVELPRHMNSLTLQKATERNIQMNPANFFILQGYLKSKSKQNILISPPIPACNYNLLYQELLCLCVTLSHLWTLSFSSTENESLENANIFIDSISVLSRGFKHNAECWGWKPHEILSRYRSTGGNRDSNTYNSV